jgi:hypothetical protein
LFEEDESQQSGEDPKRWRDPYCPWLVSEESDQRRGDSSLECAQIILTREIEEDLTTQ